ncbi:MAG: tryptophan synthase subunit alpha [Firmicutes bacterium]|nr:tryptophan synthase subunit alpha [Bacillota bacterium]
MTRIAEAFKNGKAFIPFVTCGDPDLETTARIIREMAANGADLIELGIPFSDPTAEGPVIQEANLRALSGGVTTDDIFEMVASIRTDITVPMVFMTYANVVYSYGIERFMQRSAEVGMAGLILPDVPFEEKEEFAPAAREAGMDLISLIAPTSRDRIRTIAGQAEGFVYCVSSLGVTGVRTEITTDIGAMVALVREANPEIPCAIGFGISTPEQAAAMAEHADGVIVGSAIVRLIGQYGRDAVAPVGEYVRRMKEAVRNL